MAVDPTLIENPPIETPPVEPTDEFTTQFDQWARTDEGKAYLKKHDVVAGIAGSIAETKLSLTREQERAAAAEAAVEAERQAMLDLARNDPDEFAAKFLTQAEAEHAKQEIESLRARERQAIGSRLGRAYRDAPEFQQEPLTVSEYEALTKAVMAAKSEDEQLDAYARTMNTFTARRMAKPLAQSEYEARLAEEREAAVAQANANRLRTSAAPPLGIAPSVGGNDEPDFRTDYQGWLRWNDAQKARRR